MKILEGRRGHMAICNFTPMAGTTAHDALRGDRHLPITSMPHTNLTADAGAVLFGNAVTITADGPWQHLLYQLTGRKWGNIDVENETGCGIVLIRIREAISSMRAVGRRLGAAAAHQ